MSEGKILIRGEVIAGHGLGKKLGFSTVNVLYEGDVGGVFVGRIFVNDGWRDAVIHVGHKPTIGDNKISCEAHILDWEKEIPIGTKTKLELSKKIRDTKKLENLKELKEQISKDVEIAKKLL